MRRVLGWIGGVVVLLLSASCRIRFHNDIRPELEKRGQSYALAFLHAHHLTGVLGGSPGIGAMVSRSADADLLVPAIRLKGMIPFRGSSRRGEVDKGGQVALAALKRHSMTGLPVFFAVDGPRGPRGIPKRGVAELAYETGALIVPGIATASSRWILPRSWDRFQIPKPFSRVDIRFGDPIIPTDYADVETLRRSTQEALAALERLHDPEEARRFGNTGRDS